MASTLDTFAGLGIKRIANILTVMVVVLALPVTLIAVRQANTIRQQASGSQITLSQGILSTAQTPWTVSVTGDHFNPLMKARLYDGERLWEGELTIIFENATRLSLQLPSIQPPSECIIGQSCTFSLELLDPTTNYVSNRLPLTIN